MTEGVLIVDDSPAVRMDLAEAFEAAGFAVHPCASVTEARQIFAREAISIAVLDVVLADGDGLELLKEFRASPAGTTVAILILSTEAEVKDRVAGLQTGADEYVDKPYDTGYVVARAREQSRRKQLEDESRRISDELLTKELEARESQATRELAETRDTLVRDLERKNEELDLARRQAERLSSFQSQFLANMSHELRTPLNAIIGFSELLTDESYGPLTEAQREFVNYVLDGGRHLLTLINDILDLSKIEAGRMELHRETVAPPALIGSAREIIRPFALKQGVSVHVREDADVPAVAVDPARVKQVLFNLLSNAVKFTPAGGTVTLDSSIRDGFWVVAVSDTGIGIRAQDVPRLFREFERIESTIGPKPEGTGLGLALTKRLVELHGGTIAVTSTPGQGSVFTVRLPLH